MGTRLCLLAHGPGCWAVCVWTKAIWGHALSHGKLGAINKVLLSLIPGSCFPWSLPAATGSARGESASACESRAGG